MFAEPGDLRPMTLTPERVSEYLAGLDDMAFLEVLAASGEKGSQAVLRQFHELRAARDELSHLRTRETELTDENARLVARVAELECEASELRESNRMLRIKMRDAETDDA